MSSLPQKIQQALTEPYPLTAEQIEFYRQHKYIKLKQVLNAETVAYFNLLIGYYRAFRKGYLRKSISAAF
jgi:hypothetical protein